MLKENTVTTHSVTLHPLQPLFKGSGPLPSLTLHQGKGKFREAE